MALTSGNSTLNNVTVNGDLDITSGNSTFVPNALTVTGSLNVTNTNYLVFDNATANSTAGIANIVLGGTTYTGTYGALYQTDGNTLTVASGTTIHGAYGFIGQIYNGFSVGDTLINNGTIKSDSGGNLYVYDTNFTNNGTLEATNGSTLNLNSATTKFAGGQVLVDSTSGSFAMPTDITKPRPTADRTTRIAPRTA